MSCSQRSLELEADIWGTATENTTQWILVEYTKEWIPKMRIPELHLPSQFASVLEAASKTDGWKVLYIRRSGSTGRNVYWWDITTGICKVAPIVSDWTNGLEANESWTHPQDIGLGTPQVLVCTHGNRDRCCGVLGGVIFAQLKSQLKLMLPDAVWQVSHLGGHRFAPTALCLPLGLLLGRIDVDDCSSIANAVMTNSDGALRTEIIRGDVRLSKIEQARMLWIRRQSGSFVSAMDNEFSWMDSEGLTRQTIQSKIELGEMAASCGDTKTKMMYKWDFQTP